jgi:hypothetical protein
MAYDENTAERVRRLLRGRKSVTEQPLMGGICFMVNGNMCCAVSGRGGLLVRSGPTRMRRWCVNPIADRWKWAAAS